MYILSDEQLRDVIIRAHELSTGRWVQTDTELRRRISVLLKKTILADDIMRGFLGYGGPCADRDIISGSGSLTAEDEFILDGTTPCPKCKFTEKHLASCKYRS